MTIYCEEEVAAIREELAQLQQELVIWLSKE
jgi:hypothetical protein